MRKKDDFDDEFAESNALGAIVNALDLRAKFEARRPVYATSIVVAMVAVLGGVIWYSYPQESAQREVMNTPIVRADAGDYRTTPSEPGGMAIPYRESTVFNTLRSEGRDEEGRESARVENLLPQAEQPVSRQELFAGLKVDDNVEAAPGVSMEEESQAVAAAPAETVDEMAAINTRAEAPAGEAVAKVDAPVAAAKAEAPVAPVVKAEAKSVEAKNAEVKSAEVKNAEVKSVEAKARDAARIEPAVGVAKETNDSQKAASGGYYVQMGSVRERAGAAGEWAKLQKSFSALSPLSLRVQEADLGAKGKFYRIQGGPVTEAEAKSICTRVKAQKPGGCLVVKQ